MNSNKQFLLSSDVLYIIIVTALFASAHIKLCIIVNCYYFMITYNLYVY